MKKLIFLLLFLSIAVSGWCADVKISAMTAKATPVAGDTTVIVDSADGINKKVTLGTLGSFDSGVADTKFSGVNFSGTAGENLTIGDVCYLKSDGKYWKAKADVVGTMPSVVISTGTINADAPGTFLQKGFIRNDSGWGGALTVGGLLYVSGATGGLATQTVPTTSNYYVQVVGYAYAARVIFFDPNLILVKVP